MSDHALFLTPIFDPYAGGAGIHFDQISTGLVDEGAIDSYVIISAYSDEAPVFESRANGRIFRVLFSPSSIHYRWSKCKIALNYLLATLFTIVSFIVFHTSIVHTHAKRYFTVPVWVAKRMGLYVIIDGRDLGAPSFSATGHIFIAASDNIANNARKRDEQVVKIPIGIDPSELSIECSGVAIPQESYFLFVGDIVKRKGVPELLSAYKNNSRDANLLLIGEHIDRNIMVDDIENIQYLGTKPHKTVLCYIQSADMVILPSKEEALGRVILEAIFHQTQVICPPTVPEFQHNLPQSTLSSIEPTEITEKIDEILHRGVDLDSYPIENHYMSNIIKKYASVYSTLNNRKA